MKSRIFCFNGCSFPPDGDASIAKDMNDVAILDDIFFSFETKVGVLPGLGKSPGMNELVPGDNLGANKPAFDVGVDFTGGLKGCGPL